MKLSITDDKLMLNLEWYEQLWAFNLNKTLEIPLKNIEEVTTAEPESNWQEIRAPGTFVPGIIKAGTYYTKIGREFWYVRQEKNYLTLKLKDEYYKKIIITIDESEFWANQIDNYLYSRNIKRE